MSRIDLAEVAAIIDENIVQHGIGVGGGENRHGGGFTSGVATTRPLRG